jgi:adenine-specific DNA-methyltransferase
MSKKPNTISPKEPTEEGQPQMIQPEKIDLRSHDSAGDKVAELLRLFPEIRTEGGKLDFDALKLVLGETVDVGKERYGMNWPGKADCFKTIQAPSLGTLRPCPEESVNFDTTENLFIEGDNLEVLKLLQKSYLGKVKMIYIDPPYNTGNDFIYPDNFAESLQTYLEYTGQVDAEGQKFGTNTEADGRFHSKWMNMMYPRLYLARNLLSETGFIVVSIDDAELCNLRLLLNDIFGEENLAAVLVFDRNRKNDAKLFSVGHEYMVVYANSKSLLTEMGIRLRATKEGVDELREEFNRLRAELKDDWPAITRALKGYYATFSEDDPRQPLTRYTKVDERGPYRTDGDPSWPGGGGPTYDVLHPVTRKPCKKPAGGWRFPTEERFWEEYRAHRIVFGPDETTMPSVRRNLFEKDDQVMRSVFFSYAQTATQDFTSVFGGHKVFDNPKSYVDLKRLIEYLTEPNDIVLDFFAGSASTAHAVLLANCDASPDRKFICVQLPEPCNESTPSGRAALALGMKTIAEICKERVRRVIKNLNAEDAGKLALDSVGQDRGFRVFKLAESNFTTWDAQVAHESKALERQLEFHVDHIREKRTEDDILYELLLKSGFPLTTPVETKELAGKTIYSVAGGALVICLARELTLELIRAIAGNKPERVVCLDEGFAGNDQLKANAVQTFKTKGVTSFKTV